LFFVSGDLVLTLFRWTRRRRRWRRRVRGSEVFNGTAVRGF
jgi:hypothetical protein